MPQKQTFTDVQPIPLTEGNVDLYKQPKVNNPDGSISTVDSRSYNFDGKEVLLPSVTPDGRHLKTDDEIISEYRKTGRHLGMFQDVQSANSYAEKLHNDYASGKYDKPIEKQTFTDVQPISGVVEDSGTTQDKPGVLSRFASGVVSGAKAMVPSMPDATTIALSGLGPLPGMVRSVVGGYKQARAENQPIYSSVASGIGSVLGLDAPGIRERAAKGDVAGIIGEGVPAIAATVLGGEAPRIAKGIKAVPEASRAGYRKIGNPYGLASTGEELLTQGISPYAKATGFKQALTKAGGDLKAYDANNPIKGVQDLNDAIPEIKQKIWSEDVEPALQRQGSKPVDMKPVAKSVREQITPEMKEFDESNADKLEVLSVKLENARDVTSANRLLKYVNGQLESYFAKYPSARRSNLMTNPETAGWEAARSSLRDQFLTTLEDAGETGVRDARLRYGALEEIGKQVERRVNVADRAKPMSINRILGLGLAIPSGGLSVPLGELGHYLNKPDVLIRRGMNKLSLPEAVEAIPQAKLSDLMKPKIKTSLRTKLADLFGSNKALEKALADWKAENIRKMDEVERRGTTTPGQGSNAFDQPDKRIK